LKETQLNSGSIRPHVSAHTAAGAGPSVVNRGAMAQKPRLTLYRSGRQKCGHGCGERVGPRRTIVGYVTAGCSHCGQWSLIFGAHGWSVPVPITPDIANQIERESPDSTADVLDGLGMLSS
jgi:hypothetical protein